MANFGALEKIRLDKLWAWRGGDGFPETQVVTGMEMHLNYNWTSAPSGGGIGTNGAYLYGRTVVAAGPTGWASGLFIMPDNLKVGTPISLDVGFGVASGTGNIDMTIIAVCHSHNESGDGDENDYWARHYGQHRSVTINRVDLPVVAQTFVRTSDIEIGNNGKIWTGNVKPGDNLVIQVGLEPGTTSPSSATVGTFTFFKLSYMVDNKVTK